MDRLKAIFTCTRRPRPLVQLRRTIHELILAGPADGIRELEDGLVRKEICGMLLVFFDADVNTITPAINARHERYCVQQYERWEQHDGGDDLAVRMLDMIRSNCMPTAQEMYYFLCCVILLELAWEAAYQRRNKQKSSDWKNFGFDQLNAG